MKRIFVQGLGAVSPAGWGVTGLNEAIKKNEPLPPSTLTRPGQTRTLQVRSVPAPNPRPAFFGHARLRRASALALHVVAAALEAIGEDVVRIQRGELRLGIIVGVMAGCVTYSRRFYEETLQDPTTASPLLFPETVFNAPASHLAAYLQVRTINYTLVGDNGVFLGGLALGTQWLQQEKVDACVVVGAEELDWIVVDAARLFHRNAIHTGGAGALYLKTEKNSERPILESVTDAFALIEGQTRAMAVNRMRAQLPPGRPDELLVLGTNGHARTDAAELGAWQDWPGKCIAPKKLLGEAFAASAAWQCVAACAALKSPDFSAANVSVVGADQQAIGARFVRASNGLRQA